MSRVTAADRVGPPRALTLAMQKTSWLIALVSTLLPACTSQVMGGGGPDESQTNSSSFGDGGTGGTGSDGGTGGADPSPTNAAVAMTRARLDQLWDEYWQTHNPSGSSTTTGGGP